MENLYDVLEVSRNATETEIKKSYRELVKQYHPDKTNNNPILTKKYKLIISAYNILKSTEKRKQYDIELIQFEKGQKEQAQAEKRKEADIWKQYCKEMERKKNVRKVRNKRVQHVTTESNNNAENFLKAAAVVGGIFLGAALLKDLFDDED